MASFKHPKHTRMQPLIILTLIAGLPLTAHAASLIVGMPIPDNNAIGLSSTQQVAVPFTAIGEVTVQLTMSGGWSGDLYIYLTHGSGFAVLLNRPGRSLADDQGSGATDLSIVFADRAAADIHTDIPSVGSVGGMFQPDARTIDPENSLDSSQRSAFLSSFNGLDANGDWTLYAADVSSGDTMTLNSWSISISEVPEPSAALLTAVGMLGLLRRRREPHAQRLALGCSLANGRAARSPLDAPHCLTEQDWAGRLLSDQNALGSLKSQSGCR